MSGAALYLVPVGLGGNNPGFTHPPEVIQQLHRIQYFIVERAKTARADLKTLQHPTPLQDLQIAELPEAPDNTWVDAQLAPLKQGHAIGLMSEAGCPAVADPGALIVRRAHELGLRVVPLVGPSSILLSLMASGLNGQSFSFHGYLPIQATERLQALKELEHTSAHKQATQLFIETPYRNNAMLASLLEHCQPDTLICTASSLATRDEQVVTRSVQAWRSATLPDLDRRPTMFLLLAAPPLKTRSSKPHNKRH